MKQRRTSSEAERRAAAAEPRLREDKHSRYRRRRDRGEICPYISMSPRVVELLIRLATKYGRLTESQAEARSRSRAWVVAKVVAS